MRAQLTPDDLLEATRFDIKPRRVYAAIGLGLLLLGGVLFVAMTFGLLTPKNDDFNVYAYDAVYLFLILGMAWWYWISVPRRVRKIFRQQRSLHEPFEVNVSDDGLKFESALGKGTLPWTHVYSWRESENLIFIQHSEVMRHILPKRAFGTSEDMADFKAILGREVGPVNRTRESIPEASPHEES